MNFTYKQPYVTWKGPSTGSAVPTWSRPLINNNTNENTGTNFAARPIKHWRKQLMPATNTGISRNAGVGMPMDRPGGSVYLDTTVDCSNCPVNLFELIPTTKNTIFDNTKDSSNNCVACNPETNIIKSGITLLNNNYYTDTKTYLQSRCQTYDQKLSTTPIPGNSYINPTTHQPIPPSDSPTGSQVYYTENCSKKCETVNSVVRTIYKPNNQQYSQQGAVSSSSRLTRLKNNTITKNGNTFKTAWGQQGANTGRYQGTSDSSYFLKIKMQECVPNHRNGNMNTNCLIPPEPQYNLYIVGSYYNTTFKYNVGGYWTNGIWNTLPNPGTNFYNATGISAYGTIITGFYYNGTINVGGYWKNGIWNTLSNPGSLTYSANGISADGTIITGSYNNGTYNAGGYWTNYVWTSLSNPGSLTYSANGISADGTIITGFYFNGTINVGGYWKNNVWTSLSNPGSGYYTANGISADGTIITGYYNNGTYNVGGYWTNDVWTTLLNPGSDYYTANGISADGTIITGTYNNITYEVGGYWTNGVWSTLLNPGSESYNTGGVIIL